MPEASMQLVWPGLQFLPSYIGALQQGWSPDNLRPEASLEHLARIELDPGRFVEALVDREARGGPITLPDKSTVPRLPGYAMWMWDGEFCGAIGFRWQRGTPALPPYCLGHIGYSVVPWKRGRGYATRALQLILPHAREEGLPYVELTAVADNVASQRVITKNGGVLVERFRTMKAHGDVESVRFRIYLTAPAAPAHAGDE
jgi:predicted acetyltransferase